MTSSIYRSSPNFTNMTVRKIKNLFSFLTGIKISVSFGSVFTGILSSDSKGLVLMQKSISEFMKLIQLEY